MNNYSVIRLDSVQALLDAQFAWDDLWWRSECTWPTLRAALIAQWVQRFAPQRQFEALVVEHQGAWLAALPLLRRRYCALPVGVLTSNPWAPCGELLLDSTCDEPAVINALLGALRNDGGLLWLDGVCVLSKRWQQFAQRCHTFGLPCHVRCATEVGWLEIEGNWEKYKASLSRSHRQAMTKASRRLEQAGRVQLDMRCELSGDELPELLYSGFEVEDRSWKGQAGSSVLRAVGMFDYFLDQAKQLATWRQLVLVWLRLDGRPIAFLYGYLAKNVLHAFKIGYDQQYATYSPGQLLFFYLLERLHYDGQCRAVDFMGPLTEAASRWRPASYSTGRVAVAAAGLLARAALWGYRRMWPPVRSLRDRLTQRPGAHGADKPARRTSAEKSSSADPVTFVR